MSHAGDIVHAMPFARILKKLDPTSQITWIIEERFKTLLKYEPSVDRILSFNKSHFSIKKIYKFIKFLRREKYTAVFDLQGLYKSGLISFLLKSDIRLGFSNMSKEHSEIFYNQVIELPEKKTDTLHVVKTYLKLLGKFFNQPLDKLYLQLDLNTVSPIYGPSENLQIENQYGCRIQKNPVNIIFIPFSGWQNKSIPIKVCEEFIDRVALNKKFALWIYCFGEKETKIARLLQNSRNGIHVLNDLDFNLLTPFIKKMDLAIGCDTGTLHIASQTGIDSIGIYGPTSPERNGPFLHLDNVITSGLECAPCWKRICHNNECLKIISSEQIYNKMITTLKNSGKIIRNSL